MFRRIFRKVLDIVSGWAHTGVIERASTPTTQEKTNNMATILDFTPSAVKKRADLDAFIAEARENAGSWVMLDTFVYETNGNLPFLRERKGSKGVDFRFIKALDGKGNRIVTDKGNEGWRLCAFVKPTKTRTPKPPKPVADEAAATV